MDMPANQIIPIFVLCDESLHVSDSVLNGAIESLKYFHTEVSSNPEIDNQTQFSISGFSSTWEQITPLTKPSELKELLGFQSGGQCNFGNACDQMAKVIDTAVTALKSSHTGSGTKILRPILILLLGSNPEDEWIPKFENLLDRTVYPAPSTFIYVLPAVDENNFSTLELIANRHSDICTRANDWTLTTSDAISVLRQSLLDVGPKTLSFVSENL
jgi:uncharacterized protein YegL